MKLHATVTLIFIAIVAALFINGDATNRTWGYIGRYDRLLHRDYVLQNSHWLQVVSRDVVYPPKGYVNQYIITAIKAMDRDRKNGGDAALYRGGPGYRNATIHLKSQRSHGLNFTIELYGH